ncbi:MAG: serine hydrolase [Acidobacteria bacterium]|nr:serine hydrolase [Acidobacteriota bacterium]
MKSCNEMTADPESPIDRAARVVLAESGTPGLAVTVVQGEASFARGYGVADCAPRNPVTGDTLFRIASATKSFTATALALLCDQGALAWDDPVRRFFPDFVCPAPHGADELTIRDLLCHRSGFGWHDPLWYNSPWSRRALLDRIWRIGPAATPRTRFLYSNVMYILASEIVAEVSGQSYEEFVRSRILNPLGMFASGFRPELESGSARPFGRSRDGRVERIRQGSVDKANPACGLACSAADLAHWLRFQLRPGKAGGRTMLSEKNHREMLLPHIPIRPEEAPRIYSFFGERTRLDCGLGWMLSDHHNWRVVSHTGVLPGYRAHIAVLPEAGLGVAVLANLNLTWATEALVYTLLDGCLGLPPKDWIGHFRLLAESWAQEASQTAECSSKPAGKPAQALNAYAGTFVHFAYGDLKVRRSRQGLTLSWANYRGRLEPGSENRFYLRGLNCPLMPEPETVEYDVDARGRAQALTFVGQRFERRPALKAKHAAQ